MGPNGAWTFVYLPKRASAELGARGRVPVVGTINGYRFRTSAFPTGDGTHQIAVNRAMRLGARAAPGGLVEVRLEVDPLPRTVSVPADVRSTLRREPALERTFDRLAPSHRARFIEWVESAKRPATRRRRIAELLERVRTGRGAFG